MSNIDSLVSNVKKYCNVLNIKVPPATPAVTISAPPAVTATVATSGEEYINDKLSLCNKYIELYKDKKVITCINNINNRIIAIGDIHGDIELMLNTLLISKVIQKKPNKETNNIELNNKGKIEYYEWIGGDTIVVQVGDQVDRCRPMGYFESCDKIETTFEDEASDIEILLFFTNLNELAKKKGGAVYSLLGNHELMNADRDLTYVSYKNLEQVQIKGQDLITGREQIFKRGGILSNFLACTRTTILIINDYLFVHGGILGSIFKELDNNTKCDHFQIINEVIQNWLMNDIDSNNLSTLLNKKYNNNTNKYYSSNWIDSLIYNDRYSPLWIRDLGNIKESLPKSDPSCYEVIDLIDRLELKGIIVGHTPQTDTVIENGKNVKIGNINGTCDNKLYRVDIASSKAFYYYNNNTIISPQVLEITNEKIQVLK